MHIERKRISDTETILYFAAPLPIVGSLYADHKMPAASLPQILQNIFSANICQQALLSQDFLYLQSASAEDLADLELVAIAELDDNGQSLPQTTDISVTDTKITLILKIAVAPFLQKDGGDIALEKYQNNTAYVRFLGKCHGCPYAQKTLKEKVEKTLIHYLPQIKEALLV